MTWLALIAILLAVLLVAAGVARYIQWREWDTDRRIERLRERRLR
jgi:predicted transporter